MSFFRVLKIEPFSMKMTKKSAKILEDSDPAINKFEPILAELNFFLRPPNKSRYLANKGGFVTIHA